MGIELAINRPSSLSLPVRGAWIEILVKVSHTLMVIVAPRTGSVD